MIFKIIYMFFVGFVTVNVEGFFIERFLNICKNKKIFLQDLQRKNSTYIKVKILKSDFREIKSIAKKTKCKIKIEKKSGIPFFINKYRKRKVFAIAAIVIAFFIFIITKFVWNVEVIGNENVSKEEILNILSEYGIEEGKLKSNIDSQKISNLIRLNRNEFSWIGITVKGTNVIVNVEEVTEIPEIIDKSKNCNIVAKEDAVISKIIVQNGTAKVSVGDEVKKGDLLVEGIMEGVYSGIRNVHAEANVLGKILYEKERKECFVQNEKIKTGKKEEKIEICINNFKINFNKGVSKFEKYDTITTNNKLKIFSDFYFPISLKKHTNLEYEIKQKQYSEDELKEKIIRDLELEFETEYEISKYEEKYKKRDVYTNIENGEMTVKLVYEIQKEIMAKEEVK